MARTLVRRSRPIFEDVPSLLDRFWSEPVLTMPRSVWGTETTPDIRLDVFQEGNDLKVHAAVPGLRREDLHVEVHEDELHIWGERKEEREHEDEDVYMRENRYGRVERRVTLPHEVNADAAKAKFKDGVLELTLPIRENGERRELEIGG